jgi:hypothetical protein
MILYFRKAYWAKFPVSAQPASAHAWSASGPARGRWLDQPSGRVPVSRSPIRPVKRQSNLISLEPDLNPLSYLLSHSFKPILFTFLFPPNPHEIEFDSN